MNDDYAKATAAPMFVTIGDVSYRASKFGPRDLGDLQAWLKSQVPDPRLMARELCEGLPDAVALRIWTDLSEEAKGWPPSLTSAEGNNLLMLTHEGAAQIIWVALRRYNAGVDLAEARRLAMTVSTDELAAILNAGFPEPDFSPKAYTETMTTPEMTA